MAHLIAPTSLRSLTIEAIELTNHASATHHPRDESLAADARDRLASFLETQHGITPALSRLMHQVLPI